jgi:hypothetical protein
MDIPRGAGNNAPYQCIEKLLSGRLVNTNYVGANFTLDPTIVLVLSNSPPRTTGTWSADQHPFPDVGLLFADVVFVGVLLCDASEAGREKPGQLKLVVILV